MCLCAGRPGGPETSRQVLPCCVSTVSVQRQHAGQRAGIDFQPPFRLPNLSERCPTRPPTTCVSPAGVHAPVRPADDLQPPADVRQQGGPAAAGLQPRQHAAERAAHLRAGPRLHRPGRRESEHG